MMTLPGPSRFPLRSESASKETLGKVEGETQASGHGQSQIHSRDGNVPMLRWNSRGRNPDNMIAEPGESAAQECWNQLQKNERPEQRNHQCNSAQDRQ